MAGIMLFCIIDAAIQHIVEIGQKKSRIELLQF